MCKQCHSPKALVEVAPDGGKPVVGQKTVFKGTECPAQYSSRSAGEYIPVPKPGGGGRSR